MTLTVILSVDTEIIRIDFAKRKSEELNSKEKDKRRISNKEKLQSVHRVNADNKAKERKIGRQKERETETQKKRNTKRQIRR